MQLLWDLKHRRMSGRVWTTYCYHSMFWRILEQDTKQGQMLVNLHVQCHVCLGTPSHGSIFWDSYSLRVPQDIMRITCFVQKKTFSCVKGGRTNRVQMAPWSGKTNFDFLFYFLLSCFWSSELELGWWERNLFFIFAIGIFIQFFFLLARRKC